MITEQWSTAWPYHPNPNGKTCTHLSPGRVGELLGPLPIVTPVRDNGFTYMYDATGQFVRQVHPNRATLLSIWAIADELSTNHEVTGFGSSRSVIGNRLFRWTFGLRERLGVGATSYPRRWLVQLHDQTLDNLLRGLKRTRSKTASPATVALLREKIRDIRRLRDELVGTRD